MYELAKVRAIPRRTEKDAEQAGWEAGYYGPNTSNCHFTYFATPELTAAWERGNAGGKVERANAPAKS
jgi:hypothetical protein